MRNDVKTRSLLLSLVQICLLAVFALGPITAVWAADAKSAKGAEEADCCKAEEQKELEKIKKELSDSMKKKEE